MAAGRRFAAFYEVAEPGAEVAVADVGPQRAVQRAARLIVKHARTGITCLWHALDIEPHHRARIEFRPRLPHPRHHAFIEIAVIAAALAAKTPAQRARRARHLADEALRFGPQRRRRLDGPLHRAQGAQRLYQMLAQPPHALGVLCHQGAVCSAAPSPPGCRRPRRRHRQEQRNIALACEVPPRAAEWHPACPPARTPRWRSRSSSTAIPGPTMRSLCFWRWPRRNSRCWRSPWREAMSGWIARCPTRWRWSRLAGANVPVYAGADRPLLGAFVNETRVHGVDGLGGIALPAGSQAARGVAADAIRDILRGATAADNAGRHRSGDQPRTRADDRAGARRSGRADCADDRRLGRRQRNAVCGIQCAE